MRKWLIVALSLGWLGWELFAALDTSSATWPLTEVIVTYVPAWITLPAIGILVAWLPAHFFVRYRRKGSTMEPIPVPPSKEADARNRMGRTFWQGLGVDVAIALVITVGPMLVGSSFAFSADYGKALALIVVKTVVTAAVSYATRKLVPPHFDPAREVKPAPAAKIPAFDVPPDEPDTDPHPGPIGPYRWEN